MHDIRLIRLNPEEFDKKMCIRKLSGVSKKILGLDKARRTRIKNAEENFNDLIYWTFQVVPLSVSSNTTPFSSNESLILSESSKSLSFLALSL